MMTVKQPLYTFEQAQHKLIEDLSGLDFALKSEIFRLQYPIKPIDTLAWLAFQSASIKVYGSNQENTSSIAGVGCALEVKGNVVGNYKKIFERLRQFLSPKYPHMQWYGGFAFDRKAGKDSWKVFGGYRFILPLFEVAQDGDKMILACNLMGKQNKASIIKQAKELQKPKNVLQEQPLKMLKRKDVPTRRAWEKNVTDVLKSITQKKCEKVVLARQSILTFKDELNPWQVLARLKEVTAQSYHFAFQFEHHVFLGASPERLYQRRSFHLVSQALAGTMPRSSSKEALMASSKDRHEHQVVVMAIKEALKKLSRQVRYNLEPDSITLPNGYHLNTPFQAYLNEGIKDEDILELLHPTPALGGFPRHKALAIIRSLESFDRGWYGGPLGYVGFDWSEFVVGIRSGLVSGKTLNLFAGAGIVQGSNAGAEWEEIENKISNFQKIVT